MAESDQVILPPESEATETNALAVADPHADSTTVVTSEGGKKKVRKIIKKKRRPARPQVDPATFKGSEPPAQTGTIFNIWYNKWSGGDREDAYMSKHQAKGRCNVALDSGYTKADRLAGSYFCLFFARGLCPKGYVQVSYATLCYDPHTNALLGPTASTNTRCPMQESRKRAA